MAAYGLEGAGAKRDKHLTLQTVQRIQRNLQTSLPLRHDCRATLRFAVFGTDVIKDTFKPYMVLINKLNAL